MAVIYRITNMANNHYYIGSAESFARREWQHKYALRRNEHKNPRLQAAWNKYGADMFVFEVIEIVAEGRTAFDIENTYLMKCVGQPDCYNINTDAYVPRLGVAHTEETKQKLKVSRKGKAAGAAHYRYGTKLSDEVKAKISATQKGRPSPHKGKKMSEQGKANVAAAVKRGSDCHFYGKRPAHSEDLQKVVYGRKPDGTTVEFPSLTFIRDTHNVSIATTIRACKSGNPIKFGAFAGWKFSYAPFTVPFDIPEEFQHLPRSRSEAKARGERQYYTGVPCERGHLSVRAVKGTCIACRREDEKAARTKSVDTPSTT